MSNSFYEFVSPVNPGTTIRSDKYNSDNQAVEAGFESVEVETKRAIKLPNNGNSNELPAVITDSLLLLTPAGVSAYSMLTFEAAVSDAVTASGQAVANADIATSQAGIATNAKETAVSAKNAAADKADLAIQYATHPEDVIIPGTGDYSAFHYSKKVEAMTSDSATNALKLGGQPPAYYATAAALSSKSDVGHTHTAAEIGALPKTGGTVNGPVKFEDGLHVNNNGSADGAELRIACDNSNVYIQAYEKGTPANPKGFRFAGYGGASLTTFQVKYDGVNRNIFHEGLLPTAAQIGADDTHHVYIDSGTSSSLTVDVGLATHTSITTLRSTDIIINLVGVSTRKLVEGGTLVINRGRDSGGGITINNIDTYLYDGSREVSSISFSKARRIEFTALSVKIYALTGVN